MSPFIAMFSVFHGRGVFRTQSNIKNRAFCDKHSILDVWLGSEYPSAWPMHKVLLNIETQETLVRNWLLKFHLDKSCWEQSINSNKFCFRIPLTNCFNKTDTLPSRQKDIYKISKWYVIKTSKTSCQDTMQMRKRCLKGKSESHLCKTSRRYLCKKYCRCLTELDVWSIYLKDALNLSENVS